MSKKPLASPRFAIILLVASLTSILIVFSYPLAMTCSTLTYWYYFSGFFAYFAISWIVTKKYENAYSGKWDRSHWAIITLQTTTWIIVVILIGGFFLEYLPFIAKHYHHACTTIFGWPSLVTGIILFVVNVFSYFDVEDIDRAGGY